MKKINLFINELDICLDEYSIDHAALRLKDDLNVLRLHEELLNEGKKLSEAKVNGRIIYIFKLNNPLKYKDWEIECIELPHPAKNHDYPEDDWEHIEFVLPGTDPNNLENQFRQLFPNLDEEKLKAYGFHIATPSVESEQLLNTTISLTKRKGLAIKFHCYPIEKIVKS